MRKKIKKPHTDRRYALISYLPRQVGYLLLVLYVHWHFSKEKEAYTPQEEPKSRLRNVGKK